MAPHALTVDSKGSSSSASFNEQQQFLDEHLSNPFGSTAHPELIKGTIYTSPLTIVNQTIYSISSKIFSYSSVGIDNLLDSNIDNWNNTFDRVNSFGIKPFYNKFEVRSGASNAILGYFKKNGTNGQPLSIISGSNALTYMRPTLSSSTNTSGDSPSLPLAFNVSAIDFDFNSDSLVSNYSAPLNIARSLGYSIFTPLDFNNGVEIQHTTLLNHYLVSLIGQPSLNLFDGPNFIKYYSKFSNLLSVEELGTLYQSLLNKSDQIPTNLDEAIDIAFQNLNALTGENYSQFEYIGDANADTVLISYGTFETTQLSNLIKKSGIKSIGLVKIRVPVPFNQQKFIATLPKSTKKIIILDQKVNDENTNGTGLISDITSTLFLNGLYHNLKIEEFNYPLNFEWTPITISKILVNFVDSLSEDDILSSSIETRFVDGPLTANSSPVGKYLLWGKDNGILVKTADKLALSLSLDDSKVVSIRNKFDTSSNGGIFQSQIISSENAISGGETIDSADLIILEDLSILNSYDVLATSKPESTILLINSVGKIDDVNEFVEKKLPVDFKVSLVKNQNKLVIIDLTILKELDELNQSTKGFSEEFLIQLAFWRSTLPDLKSFIVNKLLQANGNGFELLAVVLDKFIQIIDENNGLKSIEVSPEWASLEVAPVDEEKKDQDGDEILDEDIEEPVVLPFFPVETSFFPNPREGVVDSENVENNLIGYKELATKFTFAEAYGVKKELRPDLPVKNFVVKVQENKRLTPQEYSRNIFHIEFDIGDSGLTYDIGEALGIHGRNNEEDVDQFLEFYNLDGDALIETNNKDDAKILEIKSVKQILLDNLDFLGKPGKKFYESLSSFATNEKEKEHLLKLSSAEGLEELKKRQEVDFDTYVDILTEFKSARPSFEELIKIINPLKRREYSIASSQKIHTRAIHLLIVVVDWVDSRGRIRYGQCSKYLSDLKIGQELVVSVKPSVMKLPKLTTQPIIMSGLGTGLAPFKAFIEEKIWQLEQGFEIGEIYLYLGSRHKKEEYLYGELWEAYKEAGILTHIGAAFSRDQPQKIYIQDKIRESIEDLTDAVCAKQGSFYLCGPTWPVPDITACLEDIIRNGAKKEGKVVKDVAKIVEDMKEEGRYILEVY
ncbi:sulfite reductase [NADPH] flavoprotein component [Scheffersomyces coipomensis]|uniref:sulfite reductase [NADPH] flavoprotein component n=1 Tax=Scheffersomyces coipomensis TaxID=1788519 RepID=UPI00315DE301